MPQVGRLMAGQYQQTAVGQMGFQQILNVSNGLNIQCVKGLIENPEFAGRSSARANRPRRLARRTAHVPADVGVYPGPSA